MAPADDHIAPGGESAGDDAIDATDATDAIDALDAAPERGPLRRCVVTRAQGDRAAMLRFVVGPGGVLVPDLAARLPGRGIWLSARADVINSPRTRQAFSRAARARIDVPDDLASRVITGLRARIGDLIGFARRAGQAVAGYQKAQEWLVAGRAALIIQARDGSIEERARFLGVRASSVAVIAPLPAAALGRVFGRDETVHVAVAAGRLAESLRIEAARLSGVLGEPDGNAAAPAVAHPPVAELGPAEVGLGGVDGAARHEDTDGI